MTFKIGSTLQFKAMLLIWGYDILKFSIAYKIMGMYDINPWIFLFLDMVTVPTYIIGWHNLIASLGSDTRTFTALLKWSVITFASSTAPYFYAAWTGHQAFPIQAWFMFILILLFLLTNLCRKIHKTRTDKLNP